MIVEINWRVMVHKAGKYMKLNISACYNNDYFTNNNSNIKYYVF